MPFLTTNDQTRLYYKDWGSGPCVVFSHGWPLNSDAWEDQMLFLGNAGYRCVALDRRGHGRSDQPWNSNFMDGYADDLNELLTQLNLQDVTLVGHSTGGGEVVRYIGRHGSERVAKVVLIGAVTPLMLKTDANPDGIPMEVFDEIREEVQADRSGYFQELAKTFYGADKPKAEVSQGVQDAFWMSGMQAGLRGVYECIKAFSETDFTTDLKQVKSPTLIIHGDADDIVPHKLTAEKSHQLISGSKLKLYPGASHGLCTTHKDQINQDLLDFLKS